MATRALLATYEFRGTGPDGAEGTWAFHAVYEFDDALRQTRSETYGENDWSAALARFEELAAEGEPSGADIQNAATRAVDRFFDLERAGRADEAAEQLSAGVVRVDHRSAVAGATTHGREEYMTALRGAFAVGFDEVAIDHLAVRGERLALFRSRFTTESGMSLAMLSVAELDADGRVEHIWLYDDATLDHAVAELEERYVEGEGAAHAYLIRRAGDFVRSLAFLDGAATLALVHPDVRFSDHRRLGLGTMGFDGVRGILAARAEQIAEDTSYFRVLTVDGSTMMGLLESTGTSPDGSEVLWELYWVARWVAGKMLDIDWYERAERDAARARFEELAAVDPRTRHVDNALVRKLVAGAWHQAFDPAYDPQAEMAAQNAADVVVDDRRRGVSIGVLHGHDEMDENVRAQDGLFGPTIFEPIAVRGEHLALARTRAVAPSGFELVSLGVVETDAEGRYRSWTFFDDDTLDDALAELDERYLAAEGAEHADVVRAAARIDRAFNTDPDALGALCSPEFVLDDHRRLMYGAGDREYLVSIRRASSDTHVRATATINRSLFVQGRALLAVQDLHRDDAEGAEFRWAYSVLVAFDASLRLQRLEWFDDDDWDAALARFDELRARDASDSTEQPPGNEFA